MKTSTLLLLAAGGAGAYLLYRNRQAAAVTATAPPVSTTKPLVEQAAGILANAVAGIKPNFQADVLPNKYQSPPIVAPKHALSGTSLDGNVFSSGRHGSLT